MTKAEVLAQIANIEEMMQSPSFYSSASCQEHL